MTISYQLYCSRNFPPLGDTLSMLSKIGYKEVEGFGGLYEDPAALRAQCDANNLSMTTGHFGLNMLEDTPEKAIETAKAIGMHTVLIPAVGPEDRVNDAAGWAALGKRLAEAGKPIQDAGFKFGWHNHAFEFADLGGDDLPLDLIMQGSDDMVLELDLGWVGVAGFDIVEQINKWAPRMVAAHIKDIAPAGECEDEDGWADVGHGTIDWAPIKSALDAAGVSHFVMEHDNPSDHERFASRSFKTVAAF